MKFQPEAFSGVNVISRHDAGHVWVGSSVFTHSLLVPWEGPVLDWQLPGFDALTPAHFERIAAFQPELVIFGSGQRLRFAPAALMRGLIERGIGVETMDTAAACRTYNVLVSERRSALAALIVEAAAT